MKTGNKKPIIVQSCSISFAALRNALALAVICWSLQPFSAYAADCQQAVAQFMSLEGVVDVQQDGGAWVAASVETRLCEGDTIRVGDQSRAALALVNDAILRVDERSSIRLINISQQEEEQSLMELFAGAIQSFSRKPRRFRVNTPYINGSIEGTEFLVRVGPDSGRITVFEGTVVAANQHGSVSVASGEQADAPAGSAPRKSIPVRPRDQVQWGLYYPTVLSEGADAATVKASQLLQVGRVDEAEAAIDQALDVSADNGEALAVRTILRVVTLDNRAVADGRRAVELSPERQAPYLALSYAHQSEFELQLALSAIETGLAKAGQSATLLARRGELELMLGLSSQALASAEQATQLDAAQARAFSVKGYAALAEYQASVARAAFEQAIALDSANPRYHLGMGLALIAAGELGQGRQHMETAVALDSNQALLRSYLGKAYFEEKRSELAPEQLDIAAELDPNDPTSFLYGGIIKQTLNRPIDAVRDLEHSRSLNDNRAVYRSRLLLDQDSAARGTSLARAYQDIGFRQVAIVEASSSLSSDPANAAAHRFLADSYAGESRREVARVSEQLQAELLQEININPVQPSQSTTALNIISSGGPAAAGFNEFSALFERNRSQVNVTALAGNNETGAAEVVAAGNYGGFSYSAGAYHFESDGFRENNDLEHDIYTLYAQYAITPRLNIQAEYRHRETEYGDLALNFNLQDFSAALRNETEEDSARLGLRWNINEAFTLLLSGSYSDRTLELSDYDEFEIPGVIRFSSDISASGDAEAEQLEVQLLSRLGAFDVTVGGSWSQVDQHESILINIEQNIVISPDLPPFQVVEVIDENFDPDPEDERVYVYTYANYPENVTWTAGYSYQSFENESFDFTENNLKAGVEWVVVDGLTLRGAYFEVVKPVLASNRTLEPTHVAGFNQLYDDPDATRSEASALALDWKSGNGWYAGLEFSEREIDAPATDLASGSATFEAREEERARAYLNWTPNSRWALALEYVSEDFENAENTNEGDRVPAKVETDSLPGTVSYFHPNGFFGSVKVTWVDQTVVSALDPFVGLPQRPEGDDSFTITDVSLGYRLPKRRGIVSLVVQNVFDEEFSYLDDSYRSFRDEPAIAPYAPELTGLVKVTLSF